ncbi:MAG: DUF4968 domain-containing protein [Saprospiraceae bacterium]|nr:DUF4968 domain-containing protein [Saprospiraceae bacterium]
MTTDKEPIVPSDHNNEPATPAEIPFSEASVSHRHDDVFDIKTPDHITDVRWRDGAYEFTCRNGIALRIQVLSPGIVRLRYAQESIFPADFSYAINPEFTPEKVSVRLDENDNEYLLVSELLQVVVAKADLKVKFYDLDDRVICEDEGGFAARRTIMKGWCDLSVEHKCTKKFSFYGLGDKTCGSDLTGHTFENWCTDSYGFGRGSDPLYRAIPFYYALHQQLAYGIFLDNPFRSRFDFNSNENGATRFSVDGGEMNYYFIYGPEMLDVARAYARLTGVHELPPMWALGYHQCRWSYYPESVVRDLANRFRKENIPCDAIYLDIDYMDGYRCFTWNEQHFPSPKQLVADLKAQYFQTVVMIDPGIKDDPDYHVFKEGIENEMFLKTADGDIAKAPVWPGFCAFPDFTSAKVREWWGNLYHDMYDNLGVAGFWNDMNEPAVFHVNHKTLPDHVVHHYEGHGGSHRKAHNIYGQQMSRASWEGYRQLQPQKRPYLLTRATFSGGQRYSAVWTGDNGSDWEQLQIANIQCQRLAVSGFSFCGTDIGGFTGCEDGELFVRWLQLAVFHPLMRTHSKGIHVAGDGLEIQHDGEADENADGSTEFLSSHLMKSQEPWSFGAKWTDLARKAIELRYCMLPSLYTAMWLHSLDGTPVLRHMIFADAN